MVVRLNITMDRELYRRLKKELPPKGISAFVERAVRGRLAPSQRTLDAAYRAASRERWRRTMAHDWEGTETEGWPE